MTTTVSWRNAGTWGLLGLMFLLFALVVEPAPALAGKDKTTTKTTTESQWDLSQIWADTNALADVVLYEVTEDMYLRDANGNFVTSPVPGGRRTGISEHGGVADPRAAQFLRHLRPRRSAEPAGRPILLHLLALSRSHMPSHPWLVRIR